MELAMCFQESTVIRFRKVSGDLQLELEDVSFGENRIYVIITVSKLISVLVDGEEFDGLLMAAKHGEVFGLNLLEKGFELLVEWIDFKSRTSCVMEYIVLGASVVVRQGKVTGKVEGKVDTHKN